jgi:predicted phosphodiesterase
MVLAIYGQHDMKYRQKENTALGALESSCGNLRILSGEKIYSLDEYIIYGSGYGESIPKIKIRNTKSILLIHKMVVKDKLWTQQTDFVYVKDLLKENEFDIIVSGDNHTSFSDTVGKKILFNCGSLMRSTVAQIEHKPVMYMLDGKVCEKIHIPVKDFVFDERKIEIEKKRNLELDAFVKGLSEHKEMGLNFEDNLLFYFKKNNVDKEIQEFIKRCLRDLP